MLSLCYMVFWESKSQHWMLIKMSCFVSAKDIVFIKIIKGHFKRIFLKILLTYFPGQLYFFFFLLSSQTKSHIPLQKNHPSGITTSFLANIYSKMKEQEEGNFFVIRSKVFEYNFMLRLGARFHWGCFEFATSSCGKEFFRTKRFYCTLCIHIIF